MRAVLTLCLIIAFMACGMASAQHGHKLQHLKVHHNAESSLNAGGQLLNFMDTATNSKNASDVSSFLSEDVLFCVHNYYTVGTPCTQGLSGALSTVSRFMEATATVLAAPQSLYPQYPSAYAAGKFLNTGFYAKSLTSFSGELFATAEVDSNNRINRYFEFYDNSDNQSNSTAMKQVLTKLNNFMCTEGANHTEQMFAGDFNTFTVVNDKAATFLNRTEYIASLAPYFKDRVAGSCRFVIESIGVNGDFVYAESHHVYELNLGSGTGHEIQRSIDVFRLVSGGNGELLIQAWYTYGQRK